MRMTRNCQGQKTPPVLLVDGYNVLGERAKAGSGGREPAVTDSCDLADAHIFDDSARTKLELQLVAYSHNRGVKVRLDWNAAPCVDMISMASSGARSPTLQGMDNCHCRASSNR